MKTFMLISTSLVAALLTWVTPNAPFNVADAHSSAASVSTKTSPKVLLSGSRSETGFHIYPDQALDVQTGYTCTNTLTNAANFTFYVADVPNRFTLYDSNGNSFYTSGWQGNANYQGPWGSSLSTSNTFSYAYDGSRGRYITLRVETVVENAPNHTNDYWQVSF